MIELINHIIFIYYNNVYIYILYNVSVYVCVCMQTAGVRCAYIL